MSGSKEQLLQIVSRLALEYGWTKEEILTQVEPDEVKPLLEAAERFRAARNLELLSIICAPHSDKKHRERLFNHWQRLAYPGEARPEEKFDPAQILSKPMGGVGISPELAEKLRAMQNPAAKEKAA